ncbi:MAG: ATP-binding protein [Ignavibacteriae bacterium HGW-Ignavibacteriae-4]|jgi:serine/threonine-protein kinase RsbW|nr:MAG: ATP-binding protein [Ignavibacteriae bacterium HGW-Ignavibacteriae-4]
MTKELLIATDNNTLVRAEEFLNDFRSEYLIELDNSFMNILIAFTEAVNNAIYHGNKKDSNKKVLIRLEKNSKDFIIYVRDEGDGFVESEVPDPTLPENLLKQSGRGVFLIRKLTDDMNIDSTNSGTEVMMGFRL